MGETWFVFLPFAVFFGVLIGQSHRLQTCPKCGEALTPPRPTALESGRAIKIGLAFALSFGLIAAFAALWSNSSAPTIEAVPPPLALPVDAPPPRVAPPPITQPKGSPA